jgi:hypothetical protein
VKREEHIAAVVGRVWRFLDGEPHRGFRNLVQRFIEDPLKPRGDDGNVRINPILVLLAAVFLAAGGTFLLFSLLKP